MEREYSIVLHVYRRQRGSVFKNIPTFDGTRIGRQMFGSLQGQYHINPVSFPQINCRASYYDGDVLLRLFAICVINDLLARVS